jgi:transcriptional regulator with XRE-family HTH domain
VPRSPTSADRLKLLAPSTVFGVRLRQARERLAITQEELAARAGIDEFSASARISQYETGKHVPRYEIACRLAEVLDVPVAFLYARDEATAQLLLHWQAASVALRQQVLANLRK